MNKVCLIATLVVYSMVVSAQQYNDRYELVNLGRKVNTGYHEAAPVVSPDGKTLYFFVHNHPDNHYGKENSQDIWYATKNEEGEWTNAQHVGRPLNNHHANQVFTVLPDGTLFIRGGNRNNEDGFSFTRKSGNEWMDPVEVEVENFKKMNQGKFYGASLSSDGNYMILYFSEKENSSFSDLYMSKKIGEGQFSTPVKLPANINTGRDEFAPFIAPDNKTLYFSSNRKDMGEGSSDLYMTRRLDDTWLKWSDPENMGPVLNTRAFDAYMSVDAEGNIYTTQSGRTIDGGNLDIFQLIEKDIKITLRGIVLDSKTEKGIGAHMLIHRGNTPIDTLKASDVDGGYSTRLTGEGEYEIRVSLVGYVPTTGTISVKDVFSDTTIIKDFWLKPIKRNPILTGTVYDAKTDEPLEARVEIYRKGGEADYKLQANEKGYYEQEIEKKGWYLLTASKEGYLNSTDSIAYDNDDQTLLTRDLYLKPIEIGTTVRLNNIFFDFDKTTLKPESFVELDKVVEFLKNNPSVEIEIAGHTDSKGSDEYNINLSQGRAQSVVDYLISQGIESDRLIAKGYGETVPVATNETDEGRAINRRVEFTVLKK
ncbi:MAG: OmpA family protein [Fulvivirga sp.]|nr:OmpA family protein [Fulvivirga sp.]